MAQPRRTRHAQAAPDGTAAAAAADPRRHAMDEAALLQLWEAALPLPPQRREQLLAQAAGAPRAATIGQANAALLALRAQLFGARLGLQAACPACAASLEFELDARSLGHAAPDAQAAEHELRVGHETVRLRAPRLADLQALPSDDAAALARALFERCVIAAERDGRPCAAAELSEPVRAQAAQRLEAADPLANLQFALHCPDCGHAFDATLDIAALTWAELRHHAERLLADIAALADAYGWCEAEVLALSPLRRAAYLQLAAAAA